MSPEQATAAPVDRRSDDFALAICLHELLTAQRLFQRDTQVATLHALLEPTQPNVASVRADCPPALDAAISRALARDPALRTPTAQAFADELRAATTSLERWSAPQLKAWVHSCVTPERLAARSRVESLASLGWKAPSPPPRRNVALGLAVVGAAFVLTTALFWLLDRGASSTLGDTAARPPAVVDASTPAVVVDSVARAGATPLPVVDAGMAAGPVGAAPQTPAGEDAGAPTSTSERAADAGRPADKPRAVPRALTQQVIERTLNASRVAFEACGRRKGAQLPKSGAITLTLTVLRGGEVSTVSCEAAEAQLCQCMATVAKRVRFPAHTGPAITFSIPVLLTRETPPQR
jgi:hypothetical protein